MIHFGYIDQTMLETAKSGKLFKVQGEHMYLRRIYIGYVVGESLAEVLYKSLCFRYHLVRSMSCCVVLSTNTTVV